MTTDDESIEAFGDLIRRAFPDGLDKAAGKLLYSALAASDVVLRNGTRLHRSWRGVGDAIAEIVGDGTDYCDFYLDFLAHKDARVAPIRDRVLALPEVARIESYPRDGGPRHYPNETGAMAGQRVIFDADSVRYLGPLPKPGSRSRASELAERRRADPPLEA